MFSRPFNHVPLEKLNTLYSNAVKEYDNLMRMNCRFLAKEYLIAVRGYSRELSKRKEQP